jgi:hypothetical protein
VLVAGAAVVGDPAPALTGVVVEGVVSTGATDELLLVAVLEGPGAWTVTVVTCVLMRSRAALVTRL